METGRTNLKPLQNNEIIKLKHFVFVVCLVTSFFAQIEMLNKGAEN
jgi:hypothetical protein